MLKPIASMIFATVSSRDLGGTYLEPVINNFPYRESTRPSRSFGESNPNSRSGSLLFVVVPVVVITNKLHIGQH